MGRVFVLCARNRRQQSRANLPGRGRTFRKGAKAEADTDEQIDANHSRPRIRVPYYFQFQKIEKKQNKELFKIGANDVTLTPRDPSRRESGLSKFFRQSSTEWNQLSSSMSSEVVGWINKAK